MKGLIICGGIIEDINIVVNEEKKVDVVICADKGAGYAKMANIVPNLIVGDLDSVDNDAIDYYKKERIPIDTYPTDKDMTDSEIAIEKAIDMGCDELIIVGATKNRLDHCMGNILVLKDLLKKNIKAVIKDENNEVRLIDDSVELNREEGYKVSLLPLTNEVRGITTYGLKYSLDNGTLFMGKSLGVSNEFIENVAKVTIKEGLLLVIKSKD